jgi:hypothetical protein
MLRRARPQRTGACVCLLRGRAGATIRRAGRAAVQARTAARAADIAPVIKELRSAGIPPALRQRGRPHNVGELRMSASSNVQ